MPYIVSVILNILTTGLPCVLLALGIFLTFRVLDFADLTAEGSFLVGASVTGMMISLNINPFLATFCGMLGGVLCGLITGFLNRFLKIPKLLSGIITMTASATIAMFIMGFSQKNKTFWSLVTLNPDPTGGSQNQTIYSAFYIIKGVDHQVIQAVVMGIFIVVMIVALYYFFGTEYGMAIRCTGMNEKMARSQGINTTGATMACIAISNGLIGLGGALYVQEKLSVATISATGYLVVGLASILIGEAIFGTRSFKNWLISIALGTIVYFILYQITIELNFPTELDNLLYAILITIGLCMPAIKKGCRELWKKFMSLFKKEKVESEVSK